MGIIDKLLGRDTNDTNDDSNNNSPGTDRDDDGVISISTRTEILLEHYDVTGRDAKTTATLLKETLEGNTGAELDGLINDINEKTDIDRDTAETIAVTERTSIQTADRLQQYRDQGFGSDTVYKVIPDGHDICNALSDETDERDGVPLDELQDLMRKHAESHPDGTPDRVDHWVVHERCEHVVTRHVPE